MSWDDAGWHREGPWITQLNGGKHGLRAVDEVQYSRCDGIWETEGFRS